MKPEDFGYIVKNNVCLFQKGPFSQWWGGFDGQNGGFIAESYNFFGSSASFNRLISKLDKIQFNCCEQWMMAKKAALFQDIETFNKIIAESSPKEQKALGREVSGFNEYKWDKMKQHIVREGNILKFLQNKDIKEFLKSFNIHTIFAEAAPWDHIWGIGLGPENPDALDIHKWKGENLLGMVIGQVRKGI